MKVAYFVGALKQGGYESLVLDICNNKQIASYDIVCIYRKEGNYSQIFRTANVCLKKIAKTNILRYLWNFRQLVLSDKVDIVHSQTPSNTLVCALALLGTNVKVITTMHGFSFANIGGFYRRLVCAVSKRILFVSNYQKQLYINKWHLSNRDKLCTVYNGINFSKIDSASPYLEFLRNNKIRLAMVGNFVNVRSQSVIVRSIALLKQRSICNFDFFFVGRRVEGEAELYDNCVKICEDNKLSNVHFLGARDDVPSLLKVMDGFIYSSNHDTFGIAVVEAMVAGLPVVVNDWDVMREITHNGEWATLFKTEDVEDCAQKIVDLINNLPQRKMLAQQIAKDVRKEYSIENHIERLSEVYKQVL